MVRREFWRYAPEKTKRLEARKIPWKRRSIDTNQQFLDLRYTYVHVYDMFTYIYIYLQLLGFNLKDSHISLLSLKLTACPWKWMVGRLPLFWGLDYFQGRTVSVQSLFNHVHSCRQNGFFIWLGSWTNHDVNDQRKTYCWWKKSCTTW